MIKVTVTSQAMKNRAEEILAREVAANPNLNGADFSVEVGDFEEISPNDINGARLFRLIFSEE